MSQMPTTASSTESKLALVTLIRIHNVLANSAYATVCTDRSTQSREIKHV